MVVIIFLLLLMIDSSLRSRLLSALCHKLFASRMESQAPHGTGKSVIEKARVVGKLKE